MQLSKSTGLSETTRSEPGIVLPTVSEKRRYRDRVQGTIELERCFEFRVAPGRRFLRWLLENPDRMTWPASARHRATTQARREALFGRKGDSARKQVQACALQSLDRNGPEKSERRWWAFEGFTEVDCCLQTDKLVLLVEGKRTESLSKSIRWYSGRNQLHRNLEAARDLAAGREFGVFVIGEEEIPETALSSSEDGLPHLNSAERAELMYHYLGTLTLVPGLRSDWNRLQIVAAERAAAGETSGKASCLSHLCSSCAFVERACRHGFMARARPSGQTKAGA